MRLDKEILVSKTQKKFGVNDFVSVIKRVENYYDFEELVHVHLIQHGLVEGGKRPCSYFAEVGLLRK